MSIRYSKMPANQLGFTLVELMIALLIGLFLLGGLLTLLQDNRRTFSSQSQLAQLQDGERLAMSLMTDVIQTAGYFPDPTINTAQSTLLAISSPAMSSAQSVVGTYGGGTAPGDTITVRYATKSGDGILNCSGSSNATGAILAYVNTFSVAVNTVNGAPVSQLMCTQNGTAYALVSGVQNLTVSYGVNTTGSGSNVDTYMNATQVTTSLQWGNVISVLITLTFNNPLYVTANAGQPQFITLTRNVAIMNQVGL
jgi:type IV pilus assembly protein PilW